MQLLGLAFAFLALLVLSRVFLGRYERSHWRTDVAYWFLLPLVRPVVGLGVLLIGLPFALVAGLPLDATLAEGRGPLAAMPLLPQTLLALLVADFLGYWLHRLHHGLLWKTHAVHHSSPHLDWLASVRSHPLNAIAQRAPVAVVLVLMGFDLAAIGGQLAGLGFLGLVVHMRVDWAWGPFRKVLVSPRFHRWHHSRDVDCNYAGVFPAWDLLFGTYHLPDEGPETFGVRGEQLPEGVWAQLAWPLRRVRP